MLKIQINPEIDKLVPEDKEVKLLNKKYEDEGTIGEYMLLAVTSDDPFTLPALKALSEAAERINSLPEVRSVIHPFGMVTFEKNGKKLEILSMSKGGVAPENEEELSAFKNRISSDPFAKKLVISEDGKTLCIALSMFKLEDYTEFMKNMDEIITDLDRYYTTALTGHPVLSRAVHSYLIKDLSRVLALAILIILFVYYYGFKAKRASIVTMAVVGLGTIWCIGTMSLLGFSLTVISITTPPLVLTLGSSYSVHILNQYYRGAHEGVNKTIKNTANFWIADAVAHVNKTVLVAAGTTVIGFLSLLATKLDAFREFGISTSIGIFYCAILSFFFF